MSELLLAVATMCSLTGAHWKPDYVQAKQKKCVKEYLECYKYKKYTLSNYETRMERHLKCLGEKK